MTKAKFLIAAALLSTATLVPGLADARHNRHQREQHEAGEVRAADEGRQGTRGAAHDAGESALAARTMLKKACS